MKLEFHTLVINGMKTLIEYYRKLLKYYTCYTVLLYLVLVVVFNMLKYSTKEINQM